MVINKICLIFILTKKLLVFRSFKTKLIMAKNKNFRKNLAKATGKATQSALEYLFFEGGKVIVANSAFIVIQSLESHGFDQEEIEQLEGKGIHKDVFSEIYRYDFVRVIDKKFVCQKGKVTASFAVEDIEYINYKSIVDRFEPNNNPNFNKFGVDISLIQAIKDILLPTFNSQDDHKVVWEVQAPDKIMRIRGVRSTLEQERIFVMPVLLTSSNS